MIWAATKLTPKLWVDFCLRWRIFYENPQNYNIEPFRIFGNLYYVGDRKVCMHLVDTGEGLILFDSGYSHNYDVISLGNTQIRCVLSPGHTPGTMSFFFKATDGETSLNVGYFGGVGFLPLYKDYLAEYDLDPNMLDVLKQTVLSLRQYPVDIFLGNHPNHNCTLEKRQYMLEHPEENPFINPNGWQIFLDALEARRADFQRLGY